MESIDPNALSFQWFLIISKRQTLNWLAFRVIGSNVNHWRGLRQGSLLNSWWHSPPNRMQLFLLSVNFQVPWILFQFSSFSSSFLQAFSSFWWVQLFVQLLLLLLKFNVWLQPFSCLNFCCLFILVFRFICVGFLLFIWVEFRPMIWPPPKRPDDVPHPSSGW